MEKEVMNAIIEERERIRKDVIHAEPLFTKTIDGKKYLEESYVLSILTENIVQVED